VIYFYSHIFCKNVLTYYVHRITCFGTMMKLPIFISLKLLKIGMLHDVNCIWDKWRM